MKKLITFILVLSAVCLFGQHEQLYTQFMYNKQLFNPAYVGNEDVASATILIRDQWNGFEGAPKTQVVSFAAPLNNKKLGIGINVVNHKIGFSERLTLEGLYAYRIKTKKGTLSLGLQGSIRRFDVDFSDPRLFASQSPDIDPAIAMDKMSRNIFNFGFGLYYNTNLFYLGAAVPRLAQANLDFNSVGEIAQEFRHIYAMGGAAFAINEKMTFKPQVLFKYVKDAPYDLDVNLGLTWKEKYTFASTYRIGGNIGGTGESIDFIFGIQFNPQLLVSFAYDYTLSDIRTYQNGSIEIMAHYLFGRSYNQEEIINPRYF